MMLSRIFYALFIAASLASGAKADPAQDQQTELNNLQLKVLECSAFHVISKAGFEQSKSPGWEKASALSVQHAAFFNAYAIVIRDVVGQSKEGFQARMELTLDGLSDEMGRNFSNYSILLRKYAKRCGALRAALESMNK